MSGLAAQTDLPDYSTLPHPRRLPIVGDFFAVSMDKPTQSLSKLAAELGPIYEFRALGVRYVVASGVDIVRDLNDESRFCKYVGPEMEALREVVGDGLFTAYNDESNWHAAHELLMPAFTQSAMRRYHDIMLDVTAEFITRWDSAAGNRTIDVSADTTRATLETIARCAAGYSFGLFGSDTTHDFVNHMVKALKSSDLLGAARASSLPKVLDRLAARRVHRHSVPLFQMADEIIAMRRADTSVRHDDLLQLMLESDLDITNIRYQLLTFLVAGHETTSGALSFALYLLARDLKVYARARAEIDEVWGVDERPSFEQVTKLRYVRRVLDESLRLQPTVPGYYRAAREDTVLAGTYPMLKGDWVLALTKSLHRDPHWGPDPERFDPDRFDPQRVRERPTGMYKPFGTGERSCIGRQFALHEAVPLLGAIIRRYDLIPDPGYQLKIAERLTLMPTGFRLGLRQR
jgi:unspecific monooxygenase